MKIWSPLQAASNDPTGRPADIKLAAKTSPSPRSWSPILHRARALFNQLGAMPALAETDTLLRDATALGS